MLSDVLCLLMAVCLNLKAKFSTVVFKTVYNWIKKKVGNAKPGVSLLLAKEIQIFKTKPTFLFECKQASTCFEKAGFRFVLVYFSFCRHNTL